MYSLQGHFSALPRLDSPFSESPLLALAKLHLFNHLHNYQFIYASIKLFNNPYA